MKKLTSKLAMHAAFVALFAAGTIMLPTVNAFEKAGIVGKAFAKDGDGGESDSGGDGGDSGSDGDGDSDSDNDSDSDSDNDGNSGSGSSNSGSGNDDSDDDGDDNSSDDSSDDDEDKDDSRGRESRDRPEVTVSLSPEQVQSVLSGQSRLVDNLGRILELEIEVEDGVTRYTAKPHGGDARRNPGPITNVSVVPEASAPVNGSTNDDGTPDQGSGDR
jgi:hypothetical protein